MLKISISTTLRITFLMTLTLFAMGCSHSASVTPVSSVQKKFTNEFDVSTLKDVIMKAAENNNWDIISPTSESINLKKTYITKKPAISTLRIKRRYKDKVKNEVYVNIDIDKKYFTINLSQRSEQSLKKSHQIKKFNAELANLEDSIYRELARYL